MSHLPRGVPLWNHGNYLLTTLKTMHYPTPAWNCRLPIWTFVICFSSIISDVCFASQLKRCSNISLYELVMTRSIFVKIKSYRVFLSSIVITGWRSWRQRCQDQHDAMDHEDYASSMSPLSSHLTSWILGRDSCLVGVSYHSPRICL